MRPSVCLLQSISEWQKDWDHHILFFPALLIHIWHTLLCTLKTASWELGRKRWRLRSVKTLEQQDPESFGVGKHIHVPGGWCTPVSWRQKFCSGALLISPCVLLIWLLICILYDQLVSVSKVPSWVWWADLAKYQTQGGCPGSPLFIASKWEVCAAYNLQLASEIEVVLWDWA